MSTRQSVEKLISEGKSYSEIMETLGISKSCVYWHSNERNRNYAKVKRSENRAKFSRELKLMAGGKCVRCAYDKCLDALDFHHVDPSKKAGGVFDLARRFSKKVAIEESKKCILICSNCHREEHSK